MKSRSIVQIMMPMTIPNFRILTTIVSSMLLFGCATGGSDSSFQSKNTVLLLTTLVEGVVDSQVVPIRFKNRDAWLALDTGAPFTFIYSDPDGKEYVKNAGTIEIGHEKLQVPSYRDDAIGVEMFRGKPIVGVLGLDFFVDVPTEIDYPGGRIVRHLDGELPTSDGNLTELPLHGRDSARALIDVVLDGREFTLMFDTGAHDTILIDTEGGDKDELIHVQTADGQIWEVLLGKAILCLPEEGHREVPVMRAEDLPYIAPELRAIHAHGLFGLTSLGLRRVVLDFNAGVMKLGPLCSEQTN